MERSDGVDNKMSANKQMTIVEHLSELRRRFIWVLVVLFFMMVIGLVAARPIILFMKSAAPVANIEWNVFSPWDTLRIYINVSFLVALVISLPFTLYQIWAFMVPGLKPRERKAALIYIPFAFVLYVAGLLFAYFLVFPMAFYFTTTLTHSLDLTETYGIAQYFSFMFNILLPIGLLFELPVVVMFLTRIGILNPVLLTKMRRYAYFLLVVIATMITPPDIISPIIVSLPMILLYEFSVYLARRVYRKHHFDKN